MNIKIIIIVCFLLVMFFSCSKNKNAVIPNTTIKDSITVIAPVVIFADSLCQLWNKSSIIYLDNEFKKRNDSCLIKSYRYNQLKTENKFRKEFIRVIKKNGLLNNDEFYVVEMEKSGAFVSLHNYLIKKNQKNNNLDAYYFRFSNQDTTWIFNKKIEINSNKFTRFYNDIQQSNNTEGNFNVRMFNVSKFTKDSIFSYIVYCNFNNDLIDRFMELSGYYDISSSDISSKKN